MAVAKEQIRQIISENTISSVADVYTLLKDSFKDILQELMEAELDATLSYEKNHKGDLQILSLLIGGKKQMKIVIVRHAEPNYEIDSLTEKGWREAELLSDRMAKLNIHQIFVSPLGRAKDTCSLTEKVTGIKAIEKKWLREFLSQKQEEMRAAEERPTVWDQLPNEWTSDSRHLNEKEWYQTPYMTKWQVEEEYQWVTYEFDKLLKEYGYEREDRYYRVTKANDKTIVLFCHFGVEVVLLSHLMSVSPMILWHGFCAAPSSVTVVNSEERRKGIASFRASKIGDISHLYAAGEEPSFAARFCEMYQNQDQRHD